MTGALLWIVAALYGAQAIVFLADGRPAMAVVLGGYVVANIGLIWASA